MKCEATKRQPYPKKSREAVLSDRMLDAVKLYEKAREPFGRLIEVAIAVNNDLRSGRLPVQAPAPVARQEIEWKREIARLDGYISAIQVKLDRLLQQRQP